MDNISKESIKTIFSNEYHAKFFRSYNESFSPGYGKIGIYNAHAVSDNNLFGVFRQYNATDITEYNYFCIKNLFEDLFVYKYTSKDEKTLKAKKKPVEPFVSFSDNVSPDISEPKDIVRFIIPENYLKKIETESDINWTYFLNMSPKSYTIERELIKIYEDNKAEFVKEFQDHFTKKLENANYNNEKLKDYLFAVGEYYIVPADLSYEANNEFHKLLAETDSKDNFTRIIANFFISAILGLLPCKGKNNKPNYRRVYLLSEWGAEYIWLNEKYIMGNYGVLQKAKRLNKKSCYKDSCEQLEAIISNQEQVEKEILYEAYAVAGIDRLRCPDLCNDCSNRETCDIKAETTINLLSKALESSEENLKKIVYYYLYELYELKYYKENNDDYKTKYEHYLSKSYELSYVKAIIAAAKLSIASNDFLSDLGKENIIARLENVMEQNDFDDETDKANCFYYLGKLENNEELLIKASQEGHERARQEITKETRANIQRSPKFIDESNSCCIVNSLSGRNSLFLSSLPDNTWRVATTDNTGFLENILCGDRFSDNSRYIFMFAADDERKNLNDCLQLLDELFNFAIENNEKKNDIIDNIEIFVGAEYEIASMLIDASINDMGKDIYFKVHIMDKNREAAHQLLCEAPIFLPILNCEEKTNVILFGSSETNYCIIKESIASAYFEAFDSINDENSPVIPKITMVGPSAKHYENRLKQDCPGLYSEEKINCIRPKFIDCNLEEDDFPSYIYGKQFKEGQENQEDLCILGQGNYFVVDLADDYNSIRFAMNLRTWFLRNKWEFNKAPFIAVKCSDERNSYLVNHLTLSGRPAENAYYNKYDLFPFGVYKELFSYHRIIEKPRLDEIALRIHKSYYGDNMDRAAENDYYSFSYNEDSSKMMAIGIVYRLYTQGIFFDKKEQYWDYGAFDNKGMYTKYDALISEDKNLEIAAKVEQSRWNGFMLSRGWLPASIEQVQKYEKQSTGSQHKHVLAKMHPFIKEWNELEEDHKRLCELFKIKFDYEKDPVEITKKSIRETSKFVMQQIESDSKCDSEHETTAAQLSQKG